MFSSTIQVSTDSISNVFFVRVGHIEESIFEVAVKMDAANYVGGGSTDIRSEIESKGFLAG